MKRLKVLLIFPTQNHPAMPSAIRTVLTEAGSYPPLSLLHLATAVRRQEHHDITIIDALAKNYGPKEIENIIREHKPDIVGATLVTDFLKDGYNILRIAKKVSPDIITMAGGPQAILYPNDTARLKDIDYVFYGEGDEAFPVVLDVIAAGKNPDDLPFILTKENPSKQAEKALIENLDSIPVVDRTLLDYRIYDSIITRGKPIATMLTSRGCYFKCSFCPGGGTQIRMRSIPNVMEEIRDCLRLGIKDIMIFDELFTFDRPRVFEFCNEIIKNNLKFRWHVRSRVQNIDMEMVKLMKKAGCHLIQFGIESGTDRIQKLLSKNLNLQKVREIIKMVQEHGILTYGNFMLGAPTETLEEIEQTINFAKELKLDYAVFAIVHLLPGTPMYLDALKAHKIDDFWRKYIQNPDIEIENAFVPDDYSKEFLLNLGRRAYLDFYLNPGYILRYLRRQFFKGMAFKHFLPAVRTFSGFLFSNITGKK